MFHRKTRTPEYQIAGDEVAVIETGKGTIRVKLDSDGAPIHVANFASSPPWDSMMVSSFTATFRAS